MYLMYVNALLKLVRFKSTASVVAYVLLFSALMTRSFILNELLLLFIVNLFAVWTIFSFNDLEDAKFDTKFSLKKKRNPISSGLISKSTAYLIVFILSVASLSISLYVNINNFYLISLILVIGFFYSSSYFRLKTKPPFDMIAHSIIGVLVAMSVFVTLEIKLLYVVLFATFFINSAIPEILNQRYDYQIDKKTRTHTTVQILGKKQSLKLLIALAFVNLTLYGIAFFLYGGVKLLAVYIIFLPLMIIFVTKPVRRLMERKPLIITLPVLLTLFIALLGFLNIG